ncbi:MAG: DNA (cytosine-5-)-methyltransferase [Verrucomicrobiota bacterium]|jgi:DNA (cytosine-5)-methyltransferase 1
MPHASAFSTQKYFAEFFAGIGLMRLGLEKQGWTIAYANDIDPEKHEMYRAHFQDEDRHFHLGDVHDINAESIPTVALATASFPCNDLSLAGARVGLDGEQSSAFWGFIRVIREMEERRPPILLVENVTGFLNSNNGADFENALIALNRLGYLVDPFIIDAVHFVPQSRQRLFIIGMLNALHGTAALNERFYESQVRPKALAEFIFNHPGIGWQIRQLPLLPETKTDLETKLENLPENSPEWWSQDRADYLLNQMSERHRQIANQMIRGKRWSYGTVFRRVRNEKSMAELRTDGIAGCLRTPRGGSGRQILFKAGKGRYQARLLTPRECARLMGADDFTLDVPLNQALFGFGDAVCVPVIEWIVQHYLNPAFKTLLLKDRRKSAERLVYA